MWRWDQGRIGYYQFDVLRGVSRYAVANNLAEASGDDLFPFTGLHFPPNDGGYAQAWRNYGRIYKSTLIASGRDPAVAPTAVAHALAQDGVVTSDEFFHFLVRAFTSPSPAFDEWDAQAEMRFPLLFALKFMLARASVGRPETAIKHIIWAYDDSGFVGDEDDEAYIALINRVDEDQVHADRQAAESIRVIGQISYLNVGGSTVTVDLDPADAGAIFADLTPIAGQPLEDADEEIQRRGGLFAWANANINLVFEATRIDEAEEAGFGPVVGFEEGSRVRKTHLAIERNSRLRTAFFNRYPTSTCDLCQVDTAQRYPWADRVLELHHLLPLCSGTRVKGTGTVLTDLVPLCPTCHRAVHSYYNVWLRDAGRRDFVDAQEAGRVYAEAKDELRA